MVRFWAFSAFLLFSFISIAISSNHNENVISADFFNDFKFTMMYFNDVLLTEAKLSGFYLNDGNAPEFEGLPKIYSAQKLLEHTKTISGMNDYSRSLMYGLKIMKKIPRSHTNLSMWLYEFDSAFAEVRKIILPFGWYGKFPHAINIIMEKKTSSKRNIVYDIAIVNSGDGLQFHTSSPDPNNLYPELKRLWIEFINIPQDELVNSEYPWFFALLIKLYNEEYSDAIERASESSANYFYSSVLFNLKKYVKPPKYYDNSKLYPKQKSGSCSLSSLIVSYLHYAQDEVVFHKYKVILGHSIIQTFIARYGNDSDFKKLITDGFDLISRKLIKATASALAYHFLAYLEVKHAEFKNSSLLGKGISTWLVERKMSALEIIRNDREVLELMSITAGLGLRIQQLLADNPIRKETNLIKISYALVQKTFTFDLPSESLNPVNINPRNYFSSFKAPIRIKQQFEDFQSFFYALKKCNEDKMLRNRICLLDVFENTKKKDWWIYLDDNIDDSLEFLEFCKTATLNVLISADKPTSMDDILLLAHLQLGTWRSAVIYDQYRALIKLDLDKYVPPFRLVDTNHNGYSFTDGDFNNWLVFEPFFVGNIRRLNFLLSEYEKYFEGKPLLLNADQMLSFKAGKMLSDKIFMLSSDSPLAKMFEVMLTVESVRRIVEDTGDEYIMINREWGKVEYTHYHILMTRSDKLNQFFPHFYSLWSQIIWSNYAILYRPVECNQTSEEVTQAFSANQNILEELKLSCIKKSMIFKLFDSNHASLAKIPRVSEIKVRENSKMVFYRLRHCEVFSSTDFNNVDFDTWFNYIKGAVDSTIFNSIYFFHLCDIILNIPKSNAFGRVFDFLPLDSQKIISVIEEFMRIISVDLVYLIDFRDVIDRTERNQLVTRAVEVAGILIRFIDRIELNLDQNPEISERMTATFSAKIYQNFYRLINSGVGLLDSNISRIHMLLAYICSLKMKNPDKFVEILNSTVFIGLEGIEISLQSLVRIHWFLAQSNYVQYDKLFGKFDYIFDIRLIFTPVEEEEWPFMDHLIKILFLKNLDANMNNWEPIRYHQNGDLVLCSTKSDTDIKYRIIFQLSSGLIVQNDGLLPRKQIIFNRKEFKEYFPREDSAIAMKGELSKIGKTIVYVVKDYKLNGNNIIFMYDMSFDKCHIFRKIDGHWYRWLSETTDVQKSISYYWMKESKLYAKVDSARKDGSNNYASDNLLISNDLNQAPIFKIIYNSISKRIEIKFDIWGSKTILFLFKFAIDNSLVEKHFKSFSDSDFIVAYEGSLCGNQKLAFVYPGLRLKEDPHYPLILIESNVVDGGSEFRILNNPNLYVDANQIAATNIGIMGTLVVRNGEGQKFLMVPLHCKKKESNEKLKPHKIEMIPMLNNFPAPQNRLQRLLIAYYCIRANEYDLARFFLKPYTSINQNEVFSRKELEIMHWIFEESREGPESDALKLFVFMHIQINNQKFPLEYASYKKDNLVPIDQKKIFLVFIKYMSSIREISEKFYLFRIFPEILQERYSSKLFYPFQQVDEAENIKMKEFVLNCGNSMQRLPNPADQIGSIPSSVLGIIFKKLSTAEDKSELNNFLQVISKVIHRYKMHTNEIILSCIPKNMDKWEDISKEINNYCAKTNKNTADLNSILKGIKNEIESCTTSYKSEFSLFYMKKSSTFTDPKNMLSTLSLSLKRQYDDRKVNILPIDIVSDSDKIYFNNFKLDINSVIPRKAPEEATVGFDESIIEKSKVLKKLHNSIVKFGQNSETYEIQELETSALAELLKEFMKYLSIRIAELKESSKEHLLSLTIKIGTEENALRSLDHQHELIARFMHRRKLKKFENLYRCYQRMSPECIQSKFPQLNLDQSEALLQLTFEFYSNQVLQDYFELLLDTCKEWLKVDKIQIDEIILFFDELEKIHDFNSRLETPSILNLEYRSKKYRLRKQQVSDIKLLSEPKEGTDSFRSVVIQRMMAAGKTLIIGTISVVQKALQKGKLSILVPPSSLYQSNLSEMQYRSYHYFKSKGLNFTFPRFSVSADDEVRNRIIPFLENLKDTLQQGMYDRNYFILSPESLQAFLNSYIEMISFAAVNKGIVYIKAIRLYADIYLMFRNVGSIILDEIDTIMDPKKELNYPTKHFESYNMIAVVLTADLIEFSAFDQSIKALGLNIRENNQSSLSEENFTNYRNILFDYISEQLDNRQTLWHLRILNDCGTLSKDAVLDFLRTEDISYNMNLIEGLYNSKNIVVADALIILKKQLWSGLKASMNASANLNYGASGPSRIDILYAIPYAAANTPSPKSEFSDRWETLNKTLLMLVSVPCSEIIARNLIKYMRRSAIREVGFSGQIAETSIGKTFYSLLPCVNILELNETDSSHIELVQKAFSSGSQAAIRLLFSFATEKIFSKMEFPVEQITSNALNMISMFESVQGYSGTIDNINILPQEVIVSAYNDHLENEVNNGGIARKLVKDSNEDLVQIIKDDMLNASLFDMISSMILGNLEVSRLSALIDVGAFFKNFKNRQIAEALLEALKSRIDVVIYYDEKSNEVEFIRRNRSDGTISCGYISSTDPETILKATQVEMNRRFTFYDQRHITGSDILQPVGARALMTIGPRVLLRDILQGSLRMRQFMTSQKVYLLTSEATVKFYRSVAKIETDRETKVADMLTLGALNEDEKQMNENIKLAFLKINNEIRRFVMDEISNAIQTSASCLRNIANIYFKKDTNSRGQEIRDLFIRFVKEDPRSWMLESKQRLSAHVLREYVSFWLEKLEAAYEEIRAADPKIISYNLGLESSMASLKARLEKMTLPSETESNCVESLLTFLDDFIVHKGHIEGGEVEMKTENLSINDFDMENFSRPSSVSLISTDRSFGNSFDHLIDSIENENLILDTKTDFNFYSLKDVLYDEGFAHNIKILTQSALLTSGENIHVTNDLVELVSDLPQRPFKIFSIATWEASHILVQLLPRHSDIRLILSSKQFAKQIFSRIGGNLFRPKGSIFHLCNLSGEIIKSSDDGTLIGSNILDIIPDSREPFFDALIFNGSLNNILPSKILKSIYYEKWLSDSSFQSRAKFLLLRMNFLADKAKAIFSPKSEYINTLISASNGKRPARNGEDINQNLAMYQKLPIITIKSEDACEQKIAEIPSETFKEPRSLAELFNRVFKTPFMNAISAESEISREFENFRKRVNTDEINESKEL